MLNIIIGLCVLGIIVFIHELGHFIAAKLCGVTVESFLLVLVQFSSIKQLLALIIAFLPFPWVATVV